jgi:predicted  nucleic acid-binding Zn-ribbon protein
LASFSFRSSRSFICVRRDASFCYKLKLRKRRNRDDARRIQAPGCSLMNRSILIVICDFLLVSLLAFSTVDINKTTNEGTPRNVRFELAATNPPVDSGKDLAAVMRLALNEEQKRRELLLSELSKTREEVSQRRETSSICSASASGREQEALRLQQGLQAKEQESQKLQQQQAALQQQFSGAQTNIQALNQQLQNSSAQAATSKEKLDALEAERKKTGRTGGCHAATISSIGEKQRSGLRRKAALEHATSGRRN